jgi:N6-L-threonylcarbamoyladenine synthase
MSDIGLISVTQGPGLIGSLLVGFSYAKSLAYAIKVPFVGVDHMAGHLLSAFLEKQCPAFPYIALIVSGGTTALFRVDGFSEFRLVGSTRDDAAGEAFDKIARALGLGYPGGPLVAGRAASGNAEALALPRSWLADESLDFSFSGLKTAVINHCHRLRQAGNLDESGIDDICASFQQAVIDVLVRKTIDAARLLGIDTIVLGGGVSANRSLRIQMRSACVAGGLNLYLPARVNCTDNAAMIAFAGLRKYASEGAGSFDDDVFSRSPLGR